MTSTSETLSTAFRAGFGGTTIAVGDPDYESARIVWNGTVDTRPAAIARCHSVADVAAAVKLTRDAGLPLAVRGGSHSIAGLSSCDGGVVIDLSAMRAVAVDPQRRTAVVAPGATWADYDAATAPHGLASTGGLISTTGVAGLTLGGGIGWLQRRYGLACDNLRSAQVVTADGEAIEADDALLWGLRGGGGNFGVVTRFEFDLHPVSTILGGLIMFPLERGEDVLTAFREWAVDAPDEVSLLAAINTAPPEPFVPAELVGRKVVALVGCWCGDLDAGAAALAPLRALRPAVDLFGPMPYPALQGMLDAGAPYGLRNYFRGGYVADLSDEVIATALEHGARLSSPMSQIHFHQMGGAVSRAGIGTSSFSGRAAGYTYNVIGTWSDPAEDAMHIAQMRETGAALAPLSLSGSYVNFATDADPGGTRSAYGDEIYDRLARLKREYDPGNLFRRNHNVRPAP
ncbi:MAG TPA: FAD-binding oxidoreductase [Jatrophihabitans sp.]|nr:FAD-binding oxidoreductase [Jatrophihabitans sp.]